MGTDAGAAGRQNPQRDSLETKQNSIVLWAPTKELLIRIHIPDSLLAFIWGKGYRREGSRNARCSFAQVFLLAVTSQWAPLQCWIAIIRDALLTTLWCHWVLLRILSLFKGCKMPTLSLLGWIFFLLLFLASNLTKDGGIQTTVFYLLYAQGQNEVIFALPSFLFDSVVFKGARKRGLCSS